MKLKTLVCSTLIAIVGLLNTAAHAQTFSVIHAFGGVSGAYPYSGVTVRADVLYGITLCTQFCTGNGTVYQIIPVGSNWYFAPGSRRSKSLEQCEHRHRRYSLWDHGAWREQ